MSLIYPGHPDFQAWLALPPPAPRKNVCYIHRPGAAVAEAIDVEVLDDYLLSGEYDERLDEIEGNQSVSPNAEPHNEEFSSDVLYLPVSVSL
jgi:hypothetical protein